jgi:uncharacterized protein (TIGR02246 family)
MGSIGLKGGEAMDRAGVDRWLKGYLKAWKSDAPEDIAALFSEDASYSPHPFSSHVWQGRNEIVQQWIERGDSGASWDFRSEIVAVEGDAAVIEGWTTYHATASDAETAFANVWVVRFAPDGRAREFSEWWVERPRQSD